MAGCPADEPEPVTVCDGELSHADFRAFLDGNLVIVGELDDEGSSSAELLGGLVVSLVANGIDFGNLGDTRPSFSDGRYELASDDARLGFELYFADAFEGFAAGDVVPHSIFDLDSFAQNVEIQIDASQLPPVATVSYDEGPLFGLVDGEIEVSDDLTSASVKLRIRTDLLDIAVSASNLRTDVWSPGDSLQLEMATTTLGLEALAGDLEQAGVGFSYTGTHYENPEKELTQTFDLAEFMAQRLENGNYAWNGSYEATVAKGGVTLHQSGVATTLGGNYTDYFCDSSRTVVVGRANHDDSLERGVFVFEDGTEFPYGLE